MLASSFHDEPTLDKVVFLLLIGMLTLIVGGNNIRYRVKHWSSGGVKLTGKGFKVVTVSRKSVGPVGKLQNHIHLKADLGNLSAVSEVFSRVRELYGEPNLVIYNAAAYSVTDPNNAFVDSVEDFAQHLSVNTISLFETIKETIKSFDRLPRDINKTLIFTGNFLNRFPSASLLSLSVGKGASYDLLRLADMSYGKKAINFTMRMSVRKVEMLFMVISMVKPMQNFIINLLKD
ncbi:uncharacterized protein PRCAT00005812001 [Priceomyces carsonii]|uniref:uncharacterized protein n=1 Tax=Priceomyces carsonii TaxID=28549 RepID=UPI002ED7FF6D|nr:unnamed protein product [Priceomyces carsonii]